MFDGTDGWRSAGRRLLLLCNARSRLGLRPLEPALARLAEAGIELIRPHATNPGEWPVLIRRHRYDVDGVVVAGGDGSVQAALDGLLDVGLPLGVLPLGATNGVARALGLPAGSPEAASEAALAIVRGHTRRVSIGEANGVPFLSCAAVGRVSRGRLRAAVTMTSGGQPGRGLGVGLAAIPFTAEVGFGAQAWRLRAAGVVVFAGGVPSGGDAARANRLGLACIGPVLPWRLLDRLWGMPNGAVASAEAPPSAASGAGPAIWIRTERPMRVRLDGEVAAWTPVLFRLVPRALSVFAPAPDLGAGWPDAVSQSDPQIVGLQALATLLRDAVADYQAAAHAATDLEFSAFLAAAVAERRSLLDRVDRHLRSVGAPTSAPRLDRVIPPMRRSSDTSRLIGRLAAAEAARLEQLNGSGSGWSAAQRRLVDEVRAATLASIDRLARVATPDAHPDRPARPA